MRKIRLYRLCLILVKSQVVAFVELVAAWEDSSKTASFRFTN